MDCQTLRMCRDNMVGDAKMFKLHIDILKNSLSRRILHIYLEERHEQLTVYQSRALSIYKEKQLSTKFKWLEPFLVKRIDQLEPDITRLLNDKDLRKKLISLLDYLLQFYKCP